MKYCWVFDTDIYKEIFVEDGAVELDKCGIKKIFVQELPKENKLKPDNEFLKGFIKGWNEYRNRMIHGKE